MCVFLCSGVEETIAKKMLRKYGLLREKQKKIQTYQFTGQTRYYLARKDIKISNNAAESELKTTTTRCKKYVI